MPYAIEYTSFETGKTETGPILKKRIEKPLTPVIFKNMTKKEAEEYCEEVNDNPTFSNAVHTVVYEN